MPETKGACWSELVVKVGRLELRNREGREEKHEGKFQDNKICNRRSIVCLYVLKRD